MSEMTRRSDSTQLAGVVLAALAILAGCTTTPERISELEEAQAAVQQLEREPKAQTLAATQLQNARSALARADTAHQDGEPLPYIVHEATMARLNAELGLERIAEAEALERIEQAEAERTQVQLEARTTAAERAEMVAREQTAEAQQMRREAEQSREAAQAATAEAARLQQELADLEAKQTERGIVLTLGDVLFETNEAELKPGATMDIDHLAAFLEENPERRLLIEGHTDARGSEAYNEGLSRERAYAVADELAERGIERDRVRPVGLGESFPVASNDTAAGQQQNRRVEVVISDQDGSFPDAAQRTAYRQDR